MTTTQYLHAFARFWWLVTTCAAVGALVGILAVIATPTKYVASSSVVVSSRALASPPPDLYTATVLADETATLAAQRMATYKAVGESVKLAEDILRGMDSNLLASELRGRIDLVVPPGSSLLAIRVTDTSRQRAQLLASRAGAAMVDIINALDPGTEQGTTALLQAKVLPDSAVMRAASRPPAWRNPTLSGVAGLLVGLGVAVALARLNPSLRDPDVVTDLVGARVLGQVPSTRRRHQWFTRHSRPNYAEEVRELRTGIFFLRVDPDACLTVAITGISATDRVRRLVADVSTSIADTGLKVLLVDADLQAARPSSPIGEKAEHAAGLASYLSGASKVEDVICHDPESGVDIVPAGYSPSNASDILHSAAFVELLHHATKEYDFVLVTAPPMTAGTGTGAAAVAARCHVTIVTVDGRSRARQLRECLRQLATANVTASGAMLLA